MRWQPVVPLGLMTVRSKPPGNQPQVRSAVLSKSPMFFPVICTTGVVRGAVVAGIGIADQR